MDTKDTKDTLKLSNLYNAKNLTTLVGDQLKALKTYDPRKFAQVIENQLCLNSGNMPKAFKDVLKFNVPILQSELKPYVYEDKFGRGTVPTDTYFVKSCGKVSAIIKIIGGETGIGTVSPSKIPDDVYVYTVGEISEKVVATIKLFTDEIERLRAEERAKKEQD